MRCLWLSSVTPPVKSDQPMTSFASSLWDFAARHCPGIAAVSELEMVTRPEESPMGTLIAFSGGRRTRLESVGALRARQLL